MPLLEVEGASSSVLVGRLNVAEPFPSRPIRPFGTVLNVAVTVELEAPFTTPLSTPLATTGVSLATFVSAAISRGQEADLEGVFM